MRWALLAGTVAGLGIAAGPAGAVVPGTNGKMLMAAGQVPNIVSVDPATGATTALTQGNNDDRSAKYSPDGRSIAFWRFGGDTGAYSLELMNSDGSGMTAIPSTAQPPGYDDVAWSPRGNQIVVAKQSTPDGDRELVILTAGPAGFGASAPTETSLDTGQGPSAWPMDPDWSPDGKTIAFVDPGFKDGRLHVDLIPAAGGPVTTIASDSNWIMSPKWSPDGKQLVFLTTLANSDGTGEGHDIVVVNADGSGRHVVGHTDFVNLTDAVWSPDGTQIAWHTTDPNAGDEIVTHASDGSGSDHVVLTGSYTSLGSGWNTGLDWQSVGPTTGLPVGLPAGLPGGRVLGVVGKLLHRLGL